MSTGASSDPTQREVRLFVYGSLLTGEPGHNLLEGSTLLGLARTAPQFYLVDLGQYAALVPGGTSSVVGELYSISAQMRRRIDVERQVPVLFERRPVALDDGTEVDAYVMSFDKVRGRRRVAHGDWKRRFSGAAPARAPGPFVTWAKRRFDK